MFVVSKKMLFLFNFRKKVAVWIWSKFICRPLFYCNADSLYGAIESIHITKSGEVNKPST